MPALAGNFFSGNLIPAESLAFHIIVYEVSTIVLIISAGGFVFTLCKGVFCFMFILSYSS